MLSAVAHHWCDGNTQNIFPLRLFHEKWNRESCSWAVVKLRAIIFDIGIPADISDVLTKKGLWLALWQKYSKRTAFLCHWYFSKIVFRKQDRTSFSQRECAEFIKAWKMFINSATVSAWNDTFRALNRMILPHAMYYVHTTLLLHKERFAHVWIFSRHF